MAIHPRSINHLAIATRDIKTQIAFFCDVLGCELKALFWMHSAEGAWHGSSSSARAITWLSSSTRTILTKLKPA
jgi:catechol 2,3-dioxygenase-like lactoylglutathione lyase family enzyme